LSVRPRAAVSDPQSDRDGEARAVFGRAAAMREQERPVDFLNVNAAVLDGLNGAGDLKQLARGLFGIGERSIGGVFHRPRALVIAAVDD
jgi:hypothetical protein